MQFHLLRLLTTNGMTSQKDSFMLYMPIRHTPSLAALNATQSVRKSLEFQKRLLGLNPQGVSGPTQPPSKAEQLLTESDFSWASTPCFSSSGRILSISSILIFQTIFILKFKLNCLIPSLERQSRKTSQITGTTYKCY